jgi:dTDP-4-amino-4,6-dideoxy-D-galactose acyltransferase
MGETPSEPCVELPWDSDFFGFKIGRVEGDTLTETLVQRIEHWSQRNDIACLYFLARADDPVTSRLAEDNGYHLVDIRLTFLRRLTRAGLEEGSSPSRSLIIRAASADDLQTLLPVASSSYQDSRFFYDSRFPRHLSQALYEVWLTTSLSGYAQGFLVAEINGSAVGYVTCHLDNANGQGTIGLVGVAAEARGHGAGSALVNAAVSWLAERQVGEIRVVTQGRNIPAQRLYQRCGFVTDSVQLWYHKWYADAELFHDVLPDSV